jgi:hypothetical protein
MKKYLLKNVSQKQKHWLQEKFPTIKFENIVKDEEIGQHICTTKNCEQHAIYIRTYVRDRKNNIMRTSKYCEEHLEQYIMNGRKAWHKRKEKIAQKYGKQHRRIIADGYKKKIDDNSEKILKGLVPRPFRHLKIREEKARYVVLDLFEKASIFCHNEYLLDESIGETRSLIRIDMFVPRLGLFIEAKRNCNRITKKALEKQMKTYKELIDDSYRNATIISYDIDGSTGANMHFLGLFHFINNAVEKVYSKKKIYCNIRVFRKEIKRIITKLEKRRHLFRY